MADAYREQTAWPVNDPATLAGDDLLVVDGRVKAEDLPAEPAGPSQVAVDDDGDACWPRGSPGTTWPS